MRLEDCGLSFAALGGVWSKRERTRVNACVGWWGLQQGQKNADLAMFSPLAAIARAGDGSIEVFTGKIR